MSGEIVGLAGLADIAGDEERRDPGLILSDHGDQFGAGHPRHHHIGQQQIEFGSLGQYCERFRSR